MNLLPIIFDNPILLRELRRRMRGRALVYSMIGYIVLITLVALIIMVAMTPRFDFSAQDPTTGENFLQGLVRCGRTLFTWITGIQFLLVLIIAPTITAGMTTAEKERQTFDFLKVTTIRPSAYILGSFLSTVFYVALALLCALPPLCLTFLYGGVAPADVVEMFLLLFAGSLTLSAFGLYISSVRDRTRASQGIVVFVIFLILFGGLSLKTTLAVYFGGVGAAGGRAGASGFYLFGIAIPPGALVALGTLFLTGIFLLLAQRKLYRADERAFTYWQFALLFALVMFVVIGLAQNSTLGDQEMLSFAGISVALLATAAVCFGVGRMEVGDEMWHLKRLIPALRHVDEAPFFLAGVGALWALGARLWAAAPLAGAPSPGLMMALICVTLSSFALFVGFGRAATVHFATRQTAGRATLLVIAFFWAAVPLLGYLLAAISDDFSGAQDFFARFSPVFLMLEYVRDRGAGTSTLYSNATLTGNAGAFASLTYLAFLIPVALFGEIRRFRQMRGFNYHFDMPGA